MGIQLISSTLQRQWALPAVANFTMGGAGAGFYVITVLDLLLAGGIATLANRIPLGWLAPLLIGSGFVLLACEAGRPSRGAHLIRHLRRSWISRETLAFALFGITTVFDQFFPGPAVKLAAALSALCFMVCQGFIVQSARAMKAWHEPMVPIFFLSSGIASGAGMLLVAKSLGHMPLSEGFRSIAITALAINAAIWLIYLGWPSPVSRSAIRALRRPHVVCTSIGLGHGLPALLMVAGDPANAVATAWIAGAAVIIGVAAQKNGLIRSAGYSRAVALQS